MVAKYHQISLKNTFPDCQDMFLDETPSFFLILSEHFYINDFITVESFHSFYQSVGRSRIYPLNGLPSAFIIQKIFSIPTSSLLLSFLNLCKELRDFCGKCAQNLMSYANSVTNLNNDMFFLLK